MKKITLLLLLSAFVAFNTYTVFASTSSLLNNDTRDHGYNNNRSGTSSLLDNDTRDHDYNNRSGTSSLLDNDTRDHDYNNNRSDRHNSRGNTKRNKSY